MRNYRMTFMENSDIQESVKVLSIAMLDNPLHLAIFKGNGENERLAIEEMFNGLFRALPGIVFVVKEGRNIVGVMRMKSCTGSKTPSEPIEPKDENNIDWRKSVWHAEWSRNDPLEQHWHLGPIGVLPSHQGLGVGSMLMDRFCKEVDKCRAKAYLETDLDINVRFYEKFGFKLTLETEILGVKNRFMVRDCF